MSGYSPLMEDSSGKSFSQKSSVKTNILKLTNFLSSNLSGKDDITASIQKLCHESLSDNPKRKHLNFLNMKLIENPYNMEQILLRFMGIIDWKGSENLSLRSLLCIHSLLIQQQYNESSNKIFYSYLIIYFNEIKDFYKNHFNSLIFEYSLALIQRSILISKYSDIYNFILQNKLIIDPSSLKKFAPDEVLSFITSFMTLIEKYLTILRISEAIINRNIPGNYYYNVVIEAQIVSSETSSLLDSITRFILEYKQFLVTMDEKEVKDRVEKKIETELFKNSPNTTNDLLFFEDFFNSSVPSSSTTTSTPSSPSFLNESPFTWEVSVSSSNQSNQDNRMTTKLSNYSHIIATLDNLSEQVTFQKKNFKNIKN